MDKHRSNITGRGMEAQVIISDTRSEIDLDGLELLKLEFGQPGARVLCTSGTLWLTQPGDPHDHIIKAGQSFTPNQCGIVLVQGLPCGKARIQGMVKAPLYYKNNCSSQWDQPLEVE